MSAYPVATCTYGPCRKTTRDASRRCHLHRGAIYRTPAGSPTTPVPPLDTSNSWNAGTPHPTGGYDFIDVDEDSAMYSLEGDYHRTDGPAVVRYRRGEIESESWYEKGVRHRSDGPALVYYADGGMSGELYYEHGKLHRLDGPAEVFAEEDEADGYYLGGQEMTAELHAELVELVKSGTPLEWALSYSEGRSG